MRHLDCALRASCLASLICALLFVMAPVAHGGAINYGNVDAPDVMFLNVTESNGIPLDPAIQLFGPPFVPPSGNSLDFDPIGFRAEADGDANMFVDSQLNFTVMSKGDFPIRQLVFKENGQYEVIGPALANVNLSIDAVEIAEIVKGGVPMPPPFPVKASPALVFSETFMDGLEQGSWSAELVVDLDQLLLEHGLEATASKVRIALDNRLTAVSLEGGQSFIDKKDFTVTVVPEPSGMVLFACGLFGVLACLRRKRRTG